MLCGLGLALGLSLASQVSLAQEPADALAIEGEQSQRLEDLQTLRTVIDGGDVSLEALTTAREALRTLRGQSLDMIARLTSARDAALLELERLGPAPEAGEPPESEPVAAARQALIDRTKSLARLLAQSEFNASQADAALDRVAELRQALFVSDILSQGPALYQPQTWEAANNASALSLRRVLRAYTVWWDDKTRLGLRLSTLIVFAFAAFIAVLLLFPVRRKFEHPAEEAAATAPTPIADIACKTLVRVICVTAAVGALLIAAIQTGAPYLSLPALSAKVLIATALVTFVTNALWTAPGGSDEPEIDDGASESSLALDRSIRTVASTAAIIVAVQIVLMQVVLAVSSSLELASLIAAVASVAFAVLLLTLTANKPWRFIFAAADEDRHYLISVVARLRFPIILLLSVALIASLIGMARLAGYVIASAVQIGALIWFLYLMRRWIVESVENTPLLREAAALTRGGGDEDKPTGFALFWWGVALDAALILSAIPLVLLILGFSFLDMADIVGAAISGVSIGGITISLADIASALVAFLAILFATRMIQRALEQSILPNTGLDVGVQNSVATLTGYVGLIVAGVLAVSIIGLDLSNLAIIAGALSVGIGFGLQSVVNNFVSGLILLFERPIKVGDWVVTASGEGTVKRISVRSTQIDTFNRCTIIVPNSELISSTVQNWTHKDRSGRIIVPVSVSYDSDPKQVREILLDCARNSIYSLKEPAPYVYWKEFGASSLDFEVRVFIRNIANITLARNDLRFEIFDALKKNGIEIPYTQTDIHLRDMDRIETLVRSVLAPAKVNRRGSAR